MKAILFIIVAAAFIAGSVSSLLADEYGPRFNDAPPLALQETETPEEIEPAAGSEDSEEAIETEEAENEPIISDAERKRRERPVHSVYE